MNNIEKLIKENKNKFYSMGVPDTNAQRMAKVIELLVTELKRNRGYSFDRGSFDSTLMLANKIAGGEDV